MCVRACVLVCVCVSVCVCVYFFYVCVCGGERETKRPNPIFASYEPRLPSSMHGWGYAIPGCDFASLLLAARLPMCLAVGRISLWSRELTKRNDFSPHLFYLSYLLLLSLRYITQRASSQTWRKCRERKKKAEKNGERREK